MLEETNLHGIKSKPMKFKTTTAIRGLKDLTGKINNSMLSYVGSTSTVATMLLT